MTWSSHSRRWGRQLEKQTWDNFRWWQAIKNIKCGCVGVAAWGSWAATLNVLWRLLSWGAIWVEMQIVSRRQVEKTYGPRKQEVQRPWGRSNFSLPRRKTWMTGVGDGWGCRGVSYSEYYSHQRILSKGVPCRVWELTGNLALQQKPRAFHPDGELCNILIPRVVLGKIKPSLATQTFCGLPVCFDFVFNPEVFILTSHSKTLPEVWSSLWYFWPGPK